MCELKVYLELTLIVGSSCVNTNSISTLASFKDAMQCTKRVRTFLFNHHHPVSSQSLVVLLEEEVRILVVPFD